MGKMLPSRVKFRKWHRGRVYGNAKGNDRLNFGDYAIQSLERGRMTANQIEAGRVAINRYLKRRGKLWIRVFPHKPVTKKPQETRQGKGKGPVEYWAAVVRPGAILYELGGVPITAAREAMRLAVGKMPFRCRFIAREELEDY